MLGIGGMIAAPLVAGGKLAAGRMSGRVAQQVQETSQRFTRDLGDVVRGDQPGLARRTLGSAADQVQAAGESIPGLRAIAKIPAERRAAEYNQIVARALGGSADNVPGGRIPRKEMDKMVGSIQRKFDDAFADKDAVIDIGEELAAQRQLVKSLPKAERTVYGEQIEAGELTAKQFKSWYQEMNKLQASKGATEVQRTMARDIVKSLDKVAESSQHVNRELRKEARAQWRVWLAVRSGKGYTKESINPSSFGSSLHRIFGDDARLVRTEGKMDDIAELLEAAAEIENLGTAIPSSGTAERLLGAGLIGAGAAAIAQ